MAVLTTKARNKLPKRVFGLQSKRKFPMENKGHAINAKARARQELDKGHLSDAEYSEICGKANEIIAKANSNEPE
jgi:hypothetical protein